MAEIVLGIGTSHTPMLFTRPEDWPKYETRDRKMELLDSAGLPRPFDALKKEAPSRVGEALEPGAMRKAYDACQSHLDELAEAVEAAAPDVVIVIGDDQKELFRKENLPAILIYWGDHLLNKHRLPKPGEPSWWSDALEKYYGRGRDETCPVDAGLARHLIEHLTERAFDVAQSKALPEGKGEGHAFAFVHTRILERRPIPVVPVFLNTYYPPNQPTPSRCYRLGETMREAVESWNDARRVAVVASGGLSHFVIDEALDRTVLRALEQGDRDTLTSIPTVQLNSGTSEIRNWIAMHGAASHLTCEWSSYVPAYRTLAGTGTGCAFGLWT